MAVQRKPKSGTTNIDRQAANSFIDGAGDSKPDPKPVQHVAAPKTPAAKPKSDKRPAKVPVALRFDPALLEAIDTTAARRGMSRNALISYWCSKSIESE